MIQMSTSTPDLSLGVSTTWCPLGIPKATGPNQTLGSPPLTSRSPHAVKVATHPNCESPALSYLVASLFSAAAPFARGAACSDLYHSPAACCLVSVLVSVGHWAAVPVIVYRRGCGGQVVSRRSCADQGLPTRCGPERVLSPESQRTRSCLWQERLGKPGRGRKHYRSKVQL